MVRTFLLALSLVLADQALAQTPGDRGKGRELYAEKCSLCHGEHGQGWDWSKKIDQPPVPVADLAAVAPDRSDRYLFDVIKDGGEAVGRTRFMPPFGFQLSDDDVWNLVAHLRTLRKAAQP